MKITELPPTERKFQLEVTYRELRYLRNAVGDLTSSEDVDCGLSGIEASDLYEELNRVLDR